MASWASEQAREGLPWKRPPSQAFRAASYMAWLIRDWEARYAGTLLASSSVSATGLPTRYPWWGVKESQVRGRRGDGSTGDVEMRAAGLKGRDLLKEMVLCDTLELMPCPSPLPGPSFKAASPSLPIPTLMLMGARPDS